MKFTPANKTILSTTDWEKLRRISNNDIAKAVRTASTRLKQFIYAKKDA
jgi:hypothetical protein